MTKKFRPNQCPNCHFNKSDFACMNARCYDLPGEPYNPKGRSDWTQFSGETSHNCGRFFQKQSVLENSAKTEAKQ
jgi:hypothetical protein